MDTCRWCGKPLTQKHTGRRRIWCGDACRKAHERAFPRIPADLEPLPAPRPLRRIPPEDRLALILTDLRAQQCELAVMTRELSAGLAWRADELAESIRDALDHSFGGLV